MTRATSLEGKNCKVSIGAEKILGMGNWTLSGIVTDQIEDSEFEDEWKQFKLGLKDGGTISFNGQYDKTNAAGQGALRDANENDTELTDLRFYVDASSYWVPTTTNPASHIKIVGWDVSSDKNGLVQCSFTGKMSGKLELL
jgi:hypothetical protein